MGENTRTPARRSVTLRLAEVADLEAVSAIERASFSDPWSEHALAAAMSGPQTVFIVAEAASPGETAIIGYFVLTRAADEAELLNLAVTAADRRRGLGRVLLERALSEARGMNVHAVFLEVRESNAAARLLYQSAGFHQVGRRKNYYRRPAEDALIFRFGLAGNG